MLVELGGDIGQHHSRDVLVNQGHRLSNPAGGQCPVAAILVRPRLDVGQQPLPALRFDKMPDETMPDEIAVELDEELRDGPCLRFRSHADHCRVGVAPDVYLLAVLNSRLTTFWFANTFDKFQRKTFPQFKVKELAIFPIPEASEKQQAEIAKLAQLMLDMQKELQQLTENTDKHARLKTEIEKLDAKIDRAVYKLYELTDEEITIERSGKEVARLTKIISSPDKNKKKQGKLDFRKCRGLGKDIWADVDTEDYVARERSEWI